jgi:hypothetical protein
MKGQEGGRDEFCPRSREVVKFMDAVFIQEGYRLFRRKVGISRSSVLKVCGVNSAFC